MLRRLCCKDKSRGHLKTLRIIIVPSCNSDESEGFKISFGTWLQSLASDLPHHLELWYYEADKETHVRVVQQSLQAGQALLDAIYHDFEQESYSVFFICHGLGGLTIQKALCTMRDHWYQYRKLIDSVCGAVFLGVPNFAKDVAQTQRTLQYMLDCHERRGGKLPVLVQDVQEVNALSQAFELLPINFPILSCYESLPTQMRKRLFAKFRQPDEAIIAPREMCGFGKSQEVLFDGINNHIEICKMIPNSPQYEAVQNIVKQALKSLSSVAKGSPEDYIAPQGLQKLSLRSVTATEAPDHIRPEASSSDRSHGATIDPSSLVTTAGSTNEPFVVIELPSMFEATTRDLNLPYYSMGLQKGKSGFFGREDVLETIAKVLDPSSGDLSMQNDIALRSFALCGMGGMGKTEIAIHYAYTRKDRFEAIFWLNADDPNILAEQFARCAQDLGLEEKGEGRDLAASRELLKGWLSSPLSRTPGDGNAEEVSWLLIFDNVDNLDVLSDYWPTTGRGSVLITSRDPLAKQTVYTAQDGIDLRPFTITETSHLIQALTKFNTDSAELLALSQLSAIIDGLPLAIKQVAALLRSSRMIYSDFVRLYEREGAKRLMKPQNIQDDAYVSRNLITVWALDRLAAPTRALLQVMSLLDPDIIPEDLLRQEDPKVELSAYPKDYGDYYDARAELLQSSLIRQSDDGRSLSLHRLVQDSARTSMDGDTTVLAFKTALRLTCNVWPYQRHEDVHRMEHIEACTAYFPGALRLKNGLGALLHRYPTLELDVSIAELMNDAAWYMFERGLADQAKSFFGLTLHLTDNIAERDSQRVQTAVRMTHNGIGTTSAEVNHPIDCLRHQTIWASMLMTRDDTVGITVNDYEVGLAHNELGVAIAYSGDYAKAEENFLLSIEKFQQNPSYEDSWLGWPMPNLGFIYWVQGRLGEAREVLEEILDIYRQAYGSDDTTSFRTGKMLYALGNVLEDQELYDESLAVHLRCLKQYAKTIGPIHHRFGDICVRLTRHYIRLGQFSVARSYLDQAMVAFDRPWLKNEFVRAKYWESRLLLSMGDEDRARSILSEAGEDRRSLVPTDKTPVEALSSENFDALVIFWSR